MLEDDIDELIQIIDELIIERIEHNERKKEVRTLL